ncbi:hypothetical protein [Streptomyces koyangensis]|uniref:hypothetical protein n=1 Tax=Streptomyces koyangensis TaxID=188770 RepID=UPI003C2E3023
MRWSTSVATLALSGAMTLVGAAPTSAVSDNATAKLPGTRAVVSANAWHCNVYADKCSFKTSTKVRKGKNPFKVSKVSNVATVKANGWQATLSLSPSGTRVSENTRSISWTNTNTWISDISGVADPGGSINTSITTCSDGGAFKSGTKVFASACANG